MSWSSLAHLWDVPTPNVDAVISLVSSMLGKDYFVEGLTAGKLGLQDMTPADVKAYVS